MNLHERVAALEREVGVLRAAFDDIIQAASTKTLGLLRQGEICRRLGISDDRWRRWPDSGRAPAPVPGLPKRRPRWRLEDFERGIVTTGRRFLTSARRRG